MSANTFTTAQRQRIKGNLDDAHNTMREALGMSERRLHSAKHDGITGADIGREAYTMAQGLANALSSVSSAMDARDMELQGRIHELEKALSECLIVLNHARGHHMLSADIALEKQATAAHAAAVQALGVVSIFGIQQAGAKDGAQTPNKSRPVVLIRNWDKSGHVGTQTKYSVAIECGNVFGSGDVSIFPLLHSGYGSSSDIGNQDDARKHAEVVAAALGLEVVEH